MTDSDDIEGLDGLTPLEEIPSAPQTPSAARTAAPAPSNDADEVGDEDELTFTRKKEDAEMDMTPMVDIVFQLLIFFMVTASFSMQRSLEIPKPEEDKPSTAVNPNPKDIETDPDYVTVLVDRFGSFHVQTVDFDEEAPSQQELLVKLRRARRGDSAGNIPKKLLVKANGEAAHHRVVIALDAGPEVGMSEVQIQTVEDDDT